MYILAPSILAADFGNLAQEIKTIDRAGAEYVHIDVMDGMFVPSISLGIPVIQSIRPCTKCFFDVHLMIEEPIRYIDAFVQAGADGITVHVEACKHLNRTLQAIRDTGRKAAVALNPATPLTELDYVLDYVDMVLLMTVNPGFGGQKLIENTYRKVRDLREMLNQRGYPRVDIQVDGGINPESARKMIEAGANILVAGTSIFRGDSEKNIILFKEVFANAVGGSKAR